MTTRHSALGPSSWDRWIKCTASVMESRGKPDLPGLAAQEGSVFHAMVAMCLRLNLEPEIFLGWKPYDDIDFVVDSDMVEFAKPGLERIRLLMSLPGIHTYIEHQVDISPWTREGEIGSSDVIIIAPAARRIFIVDWKYGYIPVSAEYSWQPRGYGLGTWHDIGRHIFGSPEGVIVEMVIEQPRVDERPKRYIMSMNELLEFGEYVRQRALTVETGQAEYAPGEKTCDWCAAQTTCKARAAWLSNAMMMEERFLDRAQEPPRFLELTPERKAYLVRIRGKITQWLDQLHDQVLNDAKAGRPTPTLRLSRGRRPKRIWQPGRETDVQQQLGALLGSDMWQPLKVITPPDAEKKVGKGVYGEHLRGLVMQGEAKYILVPEESDAPRIAPSISVKPEDWE